MNQVFPNFMNDESTGDVGGMIYLLRGRSRKFHHSMPMRVR